MTRPGLLLVIAGPSGVGKGAITRRLLERLDDAQLSVSATTRSPRPGERDGHDYHFLDEDDFLARIERGELLEWARYGGHWYGTPYADIDEALAAGRVVILEIEVQGAAQVRARRPDALTVFVSPPSTAELERRLRARGTEDDAAVRRRLRIAERELEHRPQFDVVLVNDELDRAVDDLVDRIGRARRGGPRPIP